MQAILVSDLHLQPKAPVARAGEDDWFEAMARPLKEIEDLQAEHGCPVMYAGDIFDRWCAGPAVINFAIKHLPPGIAIPGQHDLPDHNYDEIQRSAYWTLVAAGVLCNVTPGSPLVCGEDLSLVVHGFPWGEEIKCDKQNLKGLHIALIHRYIWGKDTGYPGAPQDKLIKTYKGCLQDFDVAVFGDNHKGFIRHTKGPTICNCGGLMRRKRDERDYRPGCGLLHADGSVTRHYFDTSEEKFIHVTEAEELVGKVLDMSGFINELEGLGASDALDFVSALRHFLDDNDPPERVREILLRGATGEKM